MKFSRDEFDAQKEIRVGRANPERMHVPLWEWLVRNDAQLWDAIEAAGFGDWWDGPTIWRFNRDGMTETSLPDGRIMFIAGSCEHWCSPNFVLFNDVVVRTPEDGVEIFGYPKSDFPPTDFHSATIVGDEIILIGNRGRLTERQIGSTPVYALHSATNQIRQVHTSGQNPGWIFEHEAEFDPRRGVIRVAGGMIVGRKKGHESFVENKRSFELDVTTWCWRAV